MAWTEFHQFYKKINGEIVMVPQSKLMGVPETAEYRAPEPELNWRNLYEAQVETTNEWKQKYNQIWASYSFATKRIQELERFVEN